MSDKILQFMILIPQGIHLFTNFGIPIYRIWKGGNLLINILLSYGLFVLWATTWCVILPAIALYFSEDLFRMFPEAIGVGAIICIGWIYSLVICSVAYAIIKMARKWRSKSPNMQINPDP